MRRETTPAEFWDRMRSGGGRGRRRPERAPAPEPQPARMEQAPQPDWASAAPSEPRPSNGRGQGESKELSFADLMKHLTDQTTTLVQQKMRLAQAELQQKERKSGLATGMFAAGGVVPFFGVGTLIAVAVLALSTVLAAWLAALIVGGLILASVGVAALMGKSQIEQATPPARSQQIVETGKEDVDQVAEDRTEMIDSGWAADTALTDEARADAEQLREESAGTRA